MDITQENYTHNFKKDYINTNSRTFLKKKLVMQKNFELLMKNSLLCVLKFFMLKVNVISLFL